MLSCARTCTTGRQAMPAARTPAQIEASRRNGARSKGPVTAEGKARASRNALEARPVRHAAPGARGRGARRSGGADRAPDRRGRAPPPRSRPGWRAGSPSRSGRASGPSGSRSPCSTRRPGSARRRTARSGSRPTRSPPSTSAASTPSAASRRRSAARSGTAWPSCAGCGRTRWRARTNPRQRAPEQRNYTNDLWHGTCEPCLADLWHGGGASTPCTGWTRGVEDRCEPRARARVSA